MPRRRIILVQLPIPQPGMSPARGNVPLAAGYLLLWARKHGLDQHYDIEIFPPRLANTLSEQALVTALAERSPYLVGFSSYLWNIQRNLWVAERLKQLQPQVRILLGGPEITADNQWVLESPGVDYAAIGEGEQTFVDLLTALLQASAPRQPIPGLYRVPGSLAVEGIPTPDVGQPPIPRQPLPQLDGISSPYLEGILDAADERMLLLETIRGCIFKCKFCFYPKSYDDLYFVSREKIIANLRHARERGAREVVILDPTLNQRKNFDEFVALLRDENTGRQFTYFGELRAEGITPTPAEPLQQANFTEVEIGLQSVDPVAQELMDRKNNMKAFERGVRALRDAGIRVKVDLIIGLPGDTASSSGLGCRYRSESEL